MVAKRGSRSSVAELGPRRPDRRPPPGDTRPSARGLAGVVLALSVVSAALPARGQDSARPQRSSWRIDLQLDAPSLNPAAVQWAIFEADPAIGFQHRVAKQRSFTQGRIADAQSQAEKATQRRAAIQVAWNLGFRQVTGDKVYLLTSAPGAAHSLSSNGKAGKKWLVTKIKRIDGKPVCWRLPVETNAGETVQVTLTEQNLFDLEATFDAAMQGDRGRP